ncbi:hypothetical protein CP04DC42_0710 [Chlamydia psittaci 04DC42]|nr:hypothetical protein G5O_0308 [Chlamydia psittaci 6BC]AFS19288.1 hypothetical protein B595_0317 [Chlamydia psittaci 84/55]AFS22488.1 hypothetical protein B600_0325 [Chlamydia psittaci VS225]ATQ71311.1 uncharacterized protein CHPS25_0291 [Chlamydia psittaci]EGF85496.1 hypothetical protein G5Q_0295 [Chlamydia psittaci Cal10]EPJ14337.1 hypothetical protein CP02DC16_0715 [Chlamydia psittaci 02DC16]EPJ15081.1 hypothetical protein CP02DC15_0002 [Chlamydia psittaci 02DC15]EPJ16109.1 hypothetical
MCDTSRSACLKEKREIQKAIVDQVSEFLKVKFSTYRSK